jgi:hypothetical protein
MCAVAVICGFAEIRSSGGACGRCPRLLAPFRREEDGDTDMPDPARGQPAVTAQLILERPGRAQLQQDIDHVRVPGKAAGRSDLAQETPLVTPGTRPRTRRARKSPPPYNRESQAQRAHAEVQLSTHPPSHGAISTEVAPAGEFASRENYHLFART